MLTIFLDGCRIYFITSKISLFLHHAQLGLYSGPTRVRRGSTSMPYAQKAFSDTSSLDNLSLLFVLGANRLGNRI